MPADFRFFFFHFVAKKKKIIVISVGNLFSSFFFHVDVAEQFRVWVIIILHQLFLNQTTHSYPVTWWSYVFHNYNNTSSNQRLSQCVRRRINAVVDTDTLKDFPSWLPTSKNQPFFMNNRGFYTERYFSDKIHASLIEDYVAWQRQFP